jgi:hypothetical protein
MDTVSLQLGCNTIAAGLQVRASPKLRVLGDVLLLNCEHERLTSAGNGMDPNCNSLATIRYVECDSDIGRAEMTQIFRESTDCTPLRCNHQRQLIKMRIRFYFHVALWCALFAVFLVRSIPIVGPAVLENKIGPVDPNHSTDSYLSGLTHVRNGSELFSNLIETLPREKSLIIFVNAKSSPSEFLGMLVAYLTWPHDVRIIKVPEATLERELTAAKSSSVAGMFFCSVKPPASLAGGTHFGSAIVFVPSIGLGSNR